jgi:hypothetical protein
MKPIGTPHPQEIRVLDHWIRHRFVLAMIQKRNGEVATMD